MDAERGQDFQERVYTWVVACFGDEIAYDKVERHHRFLEEALELVQATGCTRDEALKLVDYVYGRETGDPKQEAGGVMVTLAALCQSHGIDMQESGETELARVWTKIEKIRAKQAAKPQYGPLPGPTESPLETTREMYREAVRLMHAATEDCERAKDVVITWRSDQVGNRLTTEQELTLQQLTETYDIAYGNMMKAIELRKKAGLVFAQHVLKQAEENLQ